MDETSLRAMFERAVARRPPTPRLVPDSVRAGVRLRNRRRIEAAAGSVAAIALVSAVAAAAAGPFSPAVRPPAVPAGHGSAGMAYVWSGTSTVTPIRLRTGKVLTPVKVPAVIQDIDASPDGKTVYVFSNTEPDTDSSPLLSYLTKIDAATGKADTPIKLTGNGLVSSIGQVQIAPNGKLAYATELGTWPANNVYGSFALVAINLATGAQRKLLDTGSFGCVITPDGRTAYVGGFWSEVMAVDLTTDTVLPAIKLRPPGFPVVGLAIAPGGGTAYAVSGHTVTPINTATNIAGQPIELQPGGAGDGSIAIAPDGKTAYLSGSQDVIPISLATGTVGKPIRIPYVDAERDFEISPDSKFGYDMQLQGTSVELISLVSRSLLPTLTLPGSYRQSAPGVFSGGSSVYVPASIYRGKAGSLGALFPLQLTTEHVGRPIQFPGAPNKVVLVP
jgi:DNA-binding beta-propeller fold protein YncE